MTPNFFMVGGPKCGTTALAAYLRLHPHVFMTEPKEPFFLADELSAMARIYGIRSLDDYMRLYEKASPDRHRCVGEASTLYLSSPTAINKIHSMFPEAKIIAVARDPVDVAHAYHMQACLGFHEDVYDFEKAWRLQDARLAGQAIPKTCKATRLLQYREIASLGSQLQSLLQHVSRTNVHIVSFEEFRKSPASVYRKLLAFLHLPDDGRSDFFRVNEANQHRSRLLNKFYHSTVGQNIFLGLKRSLPNFATNAIRPVSTTLLRKKQRRKPLSGVFRNELELFFGEENKKLESVLPRVL